MIKFLKNIFSTDGYVPEGQCGGWSEELIMATNIADALIWLAYMIIPLFLYVVYRQKEMTFKGLWCFFMLFVFLCGMTHFMGAVVFYWPVYRLSFIVKLLCALASIGTVFYMRPILEQMIQYGRYKSELAQIRGDIERLKKGKGENGPGDG